MTRRAATREAILDAARELAARLGPDGFTVLDVASAANVSHTTVYNHFESRRHMLEALASDWNASVCAKAADEARAAGAFDSIATIEIFMLSIARQKFELRLAAVRLFDAYQVALDGNPDLREPYLESIRRFIADELRAGMGRGEVKVENIDVASRAILILTAKFRHAVFIQKQALSELSEQLRFAFQHVFRPLLVI